MCAVVGWWIEVIQQKTNARCYNKIYRLIGVNSNRETFSRHWSVKSKHMWVESHDTWIQCIPCSARSLNVAAAMPAYPHVHNSTLAHKQVSLTTPPSFKWKKEYSSSLLFAGFNPFRELSLVYVLLLSIWWNSALYPRCVSTYSVQFWKWKADILLNNNEMILVTGKQRVLYEGRTEFLCLH